jgi:hypothetical protein
LIVGLYVDDIVSIANDVQILDQLLLFLRQKFDLKIVSRLRDGDSTKVLGITVEKTSKGIFVNMKAYIERILQKFNFTDLNGTKTPIEVKPLRIKEDLDLRSQIGSILYAVGCVLIDVAYALSHFTRFPSINSMKKSSDI